MLASALSRSRDPSRSPSSDRRVSLRRSYSRGRERGGGDDSGVEEGELGAAGPPAAAAQEVGWRRPKDSGRRHRSRDVRAGSG